MAEAPPDAERGRAAPRPFAARGDQRRDRGDVVGVGRVAQAEQHRDEEDDEDRAALRELRRCGRRDRTWLEHLRERLDGDADADDEDHERARGGQQADDRAVQRDAAEGPLGEDGDEPDRRDRGREAEAEGDDQREAEADPVQRDRAQEDDERGRARQQARGDADAEEAAPVDRRASWPWCVARGAWPWWWWWCAWPRRRSRPASTEAPTATTSSPEASVSHG